MIHFFFTEFGNDVRSVVDDYRLGCVDDAGDDGVYREKPSQTGKSRRVV